MAFDFIRSDEAGPMHELAPTLFCWDGHSYYDVRGSAVIIGKHLALTARHVVEDRKSVG